MLTFWRPHINKFLGAGSAKRKSAPRAPKNPRYAPVHRCLRCLAPAYIVDHCFHIYLGPVDQLRDMLHCCMVNENLFQ